nr:GerMN domain-containing protein [Kocuria sediminis]
MGAARGAVLSLSRWVRLVGAGAAAGTVVRRRAPRGGRPCYQGTARLRRPGPPGRRFRFGIGHGGAAVPGVGPPAAVLEWSGPPAGGRVRPPAGRTGIPHRPRRDEVRVPPWPLTCSGPPPGAPAAARSRCPRHASSSWPGAPRGPGRRPTTPCPHPARRPPPRLRPRPARRAAPPAPRGGSSAVATTKVPVYWVGAADGEQRLFREFRDATEGPTAVDPIAAAAAMLTTAAPQDPGYRTLWSPADQVGSSTSPDGTITVDLPAEAFGTGLDEQDARLALQQLAHTVTATASSTGLLPQNAEPEVVVLVDGRAREEVFGSVRLDGPLRPDGSLEAPLWLLDPQEGPHPEGAVEISGRALEGVGDCRWAVRDEDGATVAGGAVGTTARDDGTVGFRTEVELTPGRYEVEVTGRDAEGRTVRDEDAVEVVPR